MYASQTDRNLNRRRVQESVKSSYLGQLPDRLSDLSHTYEYDRVGAPALQLLPLYNSPFIGNLDVERRFYHPKLQKDLKATLR